MLFSILSITVSIFQQISHKMEQFYVDNDKVHETNGNVVKIDCKNKNLFKMTIKWNKLKKHHTYIYSLIRKVLCLTLDIEDGVGWIKVLYIVSRTAQSEIYVYFELVPPPMVKLMIDDSQEEKVIANKLKLIGTQGDTLNEFFKQEIAKELKIKLKTKRIKLNTTSVNSQPGAQTTTVVSDMDVTIEPVSTKMSQQIRDSHN